VLAALAPMALQSPAAAQVIDIRQGTNLSLAIDAKHESIVVDLLGGLWRLPLSGGGATALIPAGSGIAQPRFDASGERIVFQRWLDGQWDIWQLTLADGQYRPLTQTEFNEREPDYSPDGRQVVFSGDRTGGYEIWSLDLAGDSLRQLTEDPGDSRYPTYGAEGELAYVQHLGLHSAIKQYDGGPIGTPIVSSDRLIDSPSWRPGGGVIVYNERVEGVSSDLAFYVEADEPIQRRLTMAEDVFVGRVGWISPAEYVYAADGQLWRRRIASTERAPIHLFAGATVDPVATAPVTRALDAPGPHRVAGINHARRDAATGRWVFSALGDLWLADGDDVERLTDDAATDAWPDFVPGGRSIVFASDRGGRMQIWRLQIDSGQIGLVTAGTGRAWMPRVSADGRYMAYLETSGYGAWDAAALKLLALDTPAGPQTLATNLYDADGLNWQGNRVRLLARDSSGHERVPRVFATEAENAGAEPESNRVRFERPDADELTWEPMTPDAPYVIQAGRIFDGVGNAYNYLVDIHIQGQRITDVVRRGRLPLPQRVIDASELTVLPGLIDVHVHESTIAGSEPGRLWLMNGITMVREAMADTTEAIERAETWDSGRQLGPRVVISPESGTATPELSPDSPIVIGGAGIASGLAHGLAEQVGRGELPELDLPPALRSTTTDDGPLLPVSTLGRSYQDVFGPLTASGTWLPTGLAALHTAEPQAGVAGSARIIERVMRSSGRVAIGSDAPTVPYGKGFHRELELLAEQGIPTDQILRWATGGGAIALGLSAQLGTIEPGRLADLVIVDGDPLEDISELNRVKAVVRGGVWIAADALTVQDSGHP
jgi:hypothetical protein